MSIKREIPEMVIYKVVDGRCRQTVSLFAEEMNREIQTKHEYYPEWYMAKCYEAGRIAGIQEERQRRKANKDGLPGKLRKARGKHGFLETCLNCDISLDDLKAYESGRKAPTEDEKARLANYYGIEIDTL